MAALRAIAALVATTALSAPAHAMAARPDEPAVSFIKVTNAKGKTSARPARGGGAVLRWTTSREQGNVGFILYRARKATPRKRVTFLSRMVAGSVLKIGKTRVLKRGAAYQRFDPKGRRGDRYFIRDVDVSGRTKVRGPYVVRGASVRRGRNSPLLAPANSKQKAVRKPGNGSKVQVAPPSPVIPPGTPPDQAQALLASRQTVRLGVDTDGWTRVELATLEQRGIDVSKPANLHLFTGGREVAAVVRDGGLEFYGQAVDTLDTGIRAYFVDAELGPGLRASSAPAATSAAAAPGSFGATATRDGRTIYFQGLRNGAASNFFADVVGSSGVDVPVDAPNVASGDGARLKITLQGLTTRDHVVTVAFNGSTVGSISFPGQQASTQEFDVGGLRAGANTVRLTSAGSSDISLSGPVTLRYDHAMSADGDVLAPTVPGGQRVRIGGFSRTGARVVDVTDASAPIVLDEAGDGDAVRATAPGEGTRRLFAFAPNAVRAPASVDTGFPSKLRSAENDGALTVIAPVGYFNAVGPLVNQRRAEGLSVTVAGLQDIYDEFSFGQADHQAIRRMLDHARAAWRTKPQYVLLGGDGTYDPRGFQQRGTEGNVVPTALIDASAESPSDSSLTGTLATGRLPARSAEQMSALVAKTLRYGAQPSASSSLLFSDINDTWNFTGSSDQLKPLLPAAWGVNQIQRSEADARGRLLAALSTGPSVVNYVGHGSVDFWRGDTLKNADAPGLTNTDRLSFFVFMTCLNGYFVDPTLDALAEALVKAPGGGVAVFSSTGSTTPGPQENANQALFSALFGGAAAPRLGDAVVASLSAAGDEEVRLTWTLMGDPSLVIH